MSTTPEKNNDNNNNNDELAWLPPQHVIRPRIYPLPHWGQWGGWGVSVGSWGREGGWVYSTTLHFMYTQEKKNIKY